MKKLFTLTALTAATLTAQAQITINQSDYTGYTPTTDTFIDVSGVNVQPAANGSWDLSAVAFQGSPYTVAKTPYTNPAMPGVSFYTTGGYSFGTYNYTAAFGYGIFPTGFHRVGEAITRQAYALANLTFNPADSVIFPAQVVMYSSPRRFLAFPMTMGTNWVSDYTFSTNFELSVAAYMLNHAPCARKSHLVQTDSVKGWGKMRIKNLNGNASGWMDVLAVKTAITVSDSFFLNGVAAPAQMLGAFGMSQGQTSSGYRIAYYRAGETESVLLETYKSAAYDTVSAASVHQSRLAPGSTAVGNVVLEEEYSIYPNPAAGGAIHIAAAEATGNHIWAYQLTDIAGRKVAAGTFMMTAGKATLHTGATATGLHYLHLVKDGVTVAVKPLLITE